MRPLLTTIQNCRIRKNFSRQFKTAAEVIVDRANAKREHRGLQTWEKAPHGKIRKSDVTIAKNYLGEQELTQLERLVTAYLEFAEFQVEHQVPMSMGDWEKRLNLFIEASGSLLRLDAGTVTALEAKIHAEGEYDKYRVIQDRIFQSDYDRVVAKADAIIGSLEGGKTKSKTDKK